MGKEREGIGGGREKRGKGKTRGAGNRETGKEREGMLSGGIHLLPWCVTLNV